tara:strand:+ start:1828 stop:2001 length:174 start_codon:yes stop_codon:yes gene_type:complete
LLQLLSLTSFLVEQAFAEPSLQHDLVSGLAEQDIQIKRQVNDTIFKKLRIIRTPFFN